MSLIINKKVAAGISWIAIKEADLYLCCGCPADTVKHLKKADIINRAEIDGHFYEHGPNALLISDTLIQNGQIANLAEFPILHMLYIQGLNLPHHPNYKKNTPILIGYEDQINAQLEYASVGNHGLSSIDEIVSAGISPEDAKKIFATKIYYSGGKITHMRELIKSCILNEEKTEIKNGVYIQRMDINKFQISYKNEIAYINLNLAEDQHFPAPYTLPFKELSPGRFSITHTGEGNGWDENRPCMASVIHHNDRIYLIDAGPNILNNLASLGIGLSEIDGIFLSHIHDDHFAGITELLNVERRLNFYATKLVRITAEKKLKALTNSKLELLQVAFNCIDIEFNTWNNVNGLEVRPNYSPHTVETSTFDFRAKNNGVYKTYKHLSDTINLKEFEKIIDNTPDLFTKEDYRSVKKNYLGKVNLKKIDVGGGIIHGHLSDYEQDKSDLLVMAHTSSELEKPGENFINVKFGDTHTLIKNGDYDFFRKKSIRYLSNYFDGLNEEEILLLVNKKVTEYHPGQTIITVEDTKKIVLIISGLVSNPAPSGETQLLDAGNFIGYSKRYFMEDLPEKYQAWSHVRCLEYEESFINRFLRKFSLTEGIYERLSIINELRSSKLIHNNLSSAIYYKIGKQAEIINSMDYSFSSENLASHLFIIIQGKVKIVFKGGTAISIGRRDHFGGLALLENHRRKQEFVIEENLLAIAIPIERIGKVPFLIWRMIELEEIRYQMSMFVVK